MKTIVTRIHLWLGLFLGAQIVLWIASGVVMSWFHLTVVRGEHNMTEQIRMSLGKGDAYLPVSDVLSRLDQPATSVTLTTFLGRAVYRAELNNNTTQLLDGRTGKVLSPISQEQARAVAARDFAGDGKIVKAEFLTSLEGLIEYRRAPPVWRLTFDDTLNTRIYVRPDTGEISARRNRIWRIFDFFWMLHIMDYDERDDFNNPLLKIFAATSLLFVLSGLCLVLYRLGGSRYANDIRLLAKSLTNAK